MDIKNKILLSASVAGAVAIAVVFQNRNQEMGQHTFVDHGTPAPRLPADAASMPDLLDKNIQKFLFESDKVEDFLKKVSENEQTKSYFDRFVPIWKSSSLQPSFPGCPRILAYSEDFKFFFSFRDCPKLDSAPRKSRDDIEIVQWNEKNKSFDTYSMNYRKNGKYTGRENLHLEYNPPKCIRCHRGGLAIGAYDPFYFPNNGVSWWTNNWENFVENTKKHDKFPRYDHLNLDAADSEFPRQSAYQSYNEFAMANRLGDFNRGLASLNNQRLAYLFEAETDKWSKKPQGAQQLPNYKKLRYAIAASLSDCHNYTDMLPSYDRALTNGSKEKRLAFSEAEAVYALSQNNFKHKKQAEKAGEMHNHIVRRINVLKRMLKDSMRVETDSIFESIYRETQTSAVQKIYYSYLFYEDDFNRLQIPTREKAPNFVGVESAILHLNLSAIKMNFSPAWSAANKLAALFDRDKDLARRLKKGEFSKIVDHIRVRSGLKPNETTNNSEWQKLLSYKNREKELKAKYRGRLSESRQAKRATEVNQLKEELQAEYINRDDNNLPTYGKDKLMPKYCENIKQEYCKEHDRQLCAN